MRRNSSCWRSGLLRLRVSLTTKEGKMRHHEAPARSVLGWTVWATSRTILTVLLVYGIARLMG